MNTVVAGLAFTHLPAAAALREQIGLGRGAGRPQEDRERMLHGKVAAIGGGPRALHGATVSLIAVFAVTSSLATFDWLMSLQPEWFSTLFAGYNFAGSFLSSLAVISITAIVVGRQGALRGIVSEHHLHDPGKLILGFSTFRIYLWFSQSMLTWNGNLPEG
jgi:hypothetical protein